MAQKPSCLSTLPLMHPGTADSPNRQCRRELSQHSNCTCITTTATSLPCRYLASRCDDPLLMGGKEGAAAAMGTSRRPGAVQLQPASLAGSVLYSSPLSARSLSLSGRGKLADRGTVYTSKVRSALVAGSWHFPDVHCPFDLCKHALARRGLS